MVTGELKSKIDSLWEIFWTGGITNPLDVVEQMTYLMFIHDLDDSLRKQAGLNENHVRIIRHWRSLVNGLLTEISCSAP